jgi:hypothetical protein
MDNKPKTEAKAQGANAPKGTETATVRELGKNLPAVQHQAITLAKTIKTVEELHVKIKQRDRLELYTDQLSKFDIKKTDEDLGEASYYAGCKLELRDDDNRTFVTKHPVVIKEVIKFMFERFDARRAEIEKSIQLPNVAA